MWPTCMATISTGCGHACGSCWCAAKGNGKTRLDRWSRHGRWQAHSPAKESRTSSTFGAMTSHMTGHRGGHSSLITCHVSAEQRAAPEDEVGPEVQAPPGDHVPPEGHVPPEDRCQTSTTSSACCWEPRRIGLAPLKHSCADWDR